MHLCICELIYQKVAEPGPNLVPWSSALHCISMRKSTFPRTAAFPPPALSCPESELEQHHYPELLEDRHEEGDLLLKAGVGGSLHFLPGKIEGRNYLSENHNYANGPPPPTLSLY